jgi:hypothetical protein
MKGFFMLHAMPTEFEIFGPEGSSFTLRNFLPNHDSWALVDCSGNVFYPDDVIMLAQEDYFGHEIVRHHMQVAGGYTAIFDKFAKIDNR